MIALVFCGDLKYCPYINRYIERLEKAKCSYKVYFWNRGGYQLDLPQNYNWYQCSSSLEKSKVGKAYDFFNFRNWLIGALKKDNPERAILLSTLTGVILSDYIFSSRIPYIFDIRDYSYEHIKLFYKIEERLIKNSDFTAISSNGFKAFLPKYEYVIAHNFSRFDIKEKHYFRKSDKKINFVWNGMVRYFEYQKRYLDALKNDERFRIVFHGDGPDLDKYKSYCKSNDFNNVLFTGGYDNSLKNELLSDAHILNNCYGYVDNPGDKLKYAVSNRFYDGVVYHIPQVVEPGGYKSELVLSNNVGVSFEVDEFFADKLYHYYMQMDNNQFDESCNKMLEAIIDDDDAYIKNIDQFILSR